MAAMAAVSAFLRRAAFRQPPGSSALACSRTRDAHTPASARQPHRRAALTTPGPFGGEEGAVPDSLSSPLGAGSSRSRYPRPRVVRASTVASHSSASNFTPRLLLPHVLESASKAKVVYAAETALGHDLPGHPENNKRVVSILQALDSAGLTAQGRPGDVFQLQDFAPASLEDLAVVHQPKYIQALEKAIDMAADEGSVALESFAQTYATPTTLNDLRRAVGAGLSLIDVVAHASQTGAVPPVGFALVRPPGHHAVRHAPMGFCLAGNIALAARYAQLQGLRRVFIFDFDVHHGNGTHDLFYSDPDVFFLSTHQDGSYPGTGKVEEVGDGPGEGASLNLPLPGGAGDSALGMAMDHIVAPALARFRPDIILVSAGYDAHYMDPLAGLQFLTSSFHRIVEQLHQLAKQHCGGRMVLFLEGGYNLQALPGSVEDSVRALLGEPPSACKTLDVPEAIYEEPLASAREVIEKCRSLHSL